MKIDRNKKKLIHDFFSYLVVDVVFTVVKLVAVIIFNDDDGRASVHRQSIILLNKGKKIKNKIWTILRETNYNNLNELKHYIKHPTTIIPLFNALGALFILSYERVSYILNTTRFILCEKKNTAPQA